MDEQVQARIGHNEALFRVTNEEVTDLAGRAKTFEIVCECGYSNCRKMITVTSEAYERVRSHPLRFIVRADHQIEEVETVVEVVDSGWELGSYFVVEKGEGVPRQVAEETDPRAR